VHPRTRLLCWKEPAYISQRKQIRAAKTNQEVNRIPISGKQHYLKSKGIWYIAELERHEPKQKSPNEKVVKEILQEAYYDWWVIRKRQLSSKELKAAKLENDASD
jgi:hypothetical protein